MTSEERVALAAIRVRVERLGEKLARWRLPVRFVTETANIAQALEVLEREGEPKT